jgi:hypothetical protein
MVNWFWNSLRHLKKELLVRMKKNVLILFLAIALGTLFSCGSAPPAAPPASPPLPQTPPRADPPPQQTEDFAEARVRAVNAMEKAKSVKADVSVKAQYAIAVSAFTEAESLAASLSPGSIKKYLEAETAFLLAHDQSLVKREEAERQLARAQEAIKTAEENAAEFDRLQAEAQKQEGNR